MGDQKFYVCVNHAMCENAADCNFSYPRSRWRGLLQQSTGHHRHWSAWSWHCFLPLKFLVTTPGYHGITGSLRCQATSALGSGVMPCATHSGPKTSLSTASLSPLQSKRIWSTSSSSSRPARSTNRSRVLSRAASPSSPSACAAFGRLLAPALAMADFSFLFAF